MAIFDWGTLTWQEIRDLAADRPIAVLPVGAVEAHGPHLPLNTDCLIAEAMAKKSAENLSDSGSEVVILPGLPFAAAPFGAAFPGTLSVSATLVTAMIVDLARELTRRGFAALGLANAHLDPAHLEALAAALDESREHDLLPVVWPDITRKPWALRLTDEFRSGACHAGRFEGSVVLALRPDLVREEIRRELQPNPSSLSNAIRGGAQTFQEAGGPQAYFGWPADATAEEGQVTINVLGTILSDAIRAALEESETQ